MPDPMPDSRIFCQREGVWILFCSQPNSQFENLYISSNGKARNIKLGYQVNLIQRVQLGPLPQEVVTS